LRGQRHRKRKPTPDQEQEREAATDQGGVGAIGEDGCGSEPKTGGGKQLGVPAANPAEREECEGKSERGKGERHVQLDIGPAKPGQRRHHEEA